MVRISSLVLPGRNRPTAGGPPRGGLASQPRPNILRGIPGVRVKPGIGADDQGEKALNKTFSIDLTNAGSKTIEAGGDFCWYISSTNASDLVQVQYDDSGNDPLPFHPGNYLSGVPFRRLILTWLAQPAAVATIAIVTGGHQVRAA